MSQSIGSMTHGIRPVWMGREGICVCSTIEHLRVFDLPVSFAKESEAYNAVVTLLFGKQDVSGCNEPLCLCGEDAALWKSVVRFFKAHRFLSREILEYFSQNSLLLFDRNLRRAVCLDSLVADLHLFSSCSGILEESMLSADEQLLCEMDGLFHFKRNADGVKKSAAVEFSVVMNLSATVLFNYGRFMERLAASQDCKLENWLSNGNAAGLVKLTAHCREKESALDCLRRIRQAALIFEKTERECRELFKLSPNNLFELVRKILSDISDCVAATDDERFFWLGVLWMAKEIGMLPNFSLYLLHFWLLEMMGKSLNDNAQMALIMLKQCFEQVVLL